MTNDLTGTRQNTYVVGYGNQQHVVMSRRSAEVEAGFLMPYLRPGMRLLDCGSGPGTITLGLAAAVAPGDVVGLDLSSLQVERARQRAEESGVTNIRFLVGDVNDLPFPDASFDVVFANAVLMHLSDPVAALREMSRVVRPGGILAVRDHGDRFREPATAATRQFAELLESVAQENLGRPNPMFGMRHRQALIEAGCARAEGFADVIVKGEPSVLRDHFQLMRGIVSDDNFRRTAARAGFDSEALDRLINDLGDWYERPDAVVVVVWSAGIGWVD